MSSQLIPVKKRREFILVSRFGMSIGKGGVYVQAAQISSPNFNSFIKFGFTISKKVGKAVKRNQVRRRFRVLAHKLLPLCKSGYYYIFMGNSYTPRCSFKNIEKNLVFCLNHLQLYQK